jgi:peptidoglycan/LPS O-acetylase OafA/YrhL
MTTSIERRSPVGTRPARVSPRAEKAVSFRTDIEGLRAVAVTAVVAYHVGIPGVSGGFVGVDVFFVISGFLITGLLLREVAATGRIAFDAFYGRRARRILPSASIVVIVVALASFLIYSPLGAVAVMKDLVASAFFYANWHFIASGTNYLAASDANSPVLHFWSLAVEEQFYLVWPLLIFGIVGLSRRFPRHSTRIVAILIGLITVASFLYCIEATSTNANVAYLATTTRAWEFGLGAVVACVSPAAGRAAARLRLGWLSWALGVFGLGGLVWSVVAFDADTIFPGAAAAAPTLATASIILGGSMTGGSLNAVGTFLSLRPIRYLGRLSFGWYLWHWPVLILTEERAGVLALPGRIALTLVALLLAAGTLHLVETPISHLKEVVTNTRSAMALGLLALVLAAASSMTVGQVEIAQASSLRASAAASTAAAQFRDLQRTGDGVRGAVTPSSIEAAKDMPALPAGCLATVVATTSPSCEITSSGAVDTAAPAGRVVLLGDSHAEQWYPIARALANARNTDVEVLTKAGCPLATLTIRSPQLSGPYTQCDRWRENVLTRLDREAKPSMIIISSLTRYSGSVPLDQAWATTMSRLGALRAPIVYMADTPYPVFDVPSCISGHVAQWSGCGIDRRTAFQPDALMAGIAARRFANAHTVDMNTVLCPAVDAICPAVRNGLLLYRDNSHVTNSAMTALVPLALPAFHRLGLYK